MFACRRQGVGDMIAKGWFMFGNLDHDEFLLLTAKNLSEQFVPEGALDPFLRRL